MQLSDSLHPAFIVLPFAMLFALAVTVTAGTFKKYIRAGESSHSPPAIRNLMKILTILNVNAVSVQNSEYKVR